MKRSYAAMLAEDVATPDRMRVGPPTPGANSCAFDGPAAAPYFGTASDHSNSSGMHSPTSSSSLSQLSLTLSNANLGASTPTTTSGARTNAFQLLRTAQRKQLFDDGTPSAKRLRQMDSLTMTSSTSTSSLSKSSVDENHDNETNKEKNRSSDLDPNSDYFKPSRPSSQFVSDYLSSKVRQHPSYEGDVESEMESKVDDRAEARRRKMAAITGHLMTTNDNGMGDATSTNPFFISNMSFDMKSGKCRKYTRREVEAMIAEALAEREEEIRAEFHREMKRLLKEQFDAFTHFHSQYMQRNFRGDDSYFS